MTDTASAQLKRILHLIPRVADGEDHTVAELAGAAGMSPAELLRDLDAISGRFDAPGGFVEGVSILVEQDTVCVNASHFHRPMRLTMPELCALELGLSMLRRERTPAEQGPIDRALARLRQTISRVPQLDRHEGTRFADLNDAGCAAHLAALRAAVAGRRKVSLTYRAGGATESTTRTICPHSMVFADFAWYVIATGDDDTVRFFRVDRVRDVAPLSDTFERNDAVALRVQETGRAFDSPTERRMRVRYGPRIARWVAEREGTSVAPGDSLVMEHPLADDSWAMRHVLQYGPDAELLEPPELRARIAERLSPPGAGGAVRPSP